MKKAFKYRIYPTRKQRDTLQFTLDRNRKLYSTMQLLKSAMKHGE